MSKAKLALLPIAATVLLSSLCTAQCIPFADANEQIGATRCITGKVLKVEEGQAGVTYLNFCEDYRSCPFTVVVFPSDLKHVGDVRELKNQLIEVDGDVKQYDGHAEIILSRPQQLRGEASRIPPLPKGYDVEKRGHYSAGQFKHARAPRKKHPKRQPVAAMANIGETEPE